MSMRGELGSCESFLSSSNARVASTANRSMIMPLAWPMHLCWPRHWNCSSLQWVMSAVAACVAKIRAPHGRLRRHCAGISRDAALYLERSTVSEQSEWLPCTSL
jgi:hypothetical protein